MAVRILRNSLVAFPIAGPRGRGRFRAALPGFALALALMAQPGLCRAVTFQEQAERLQLIYAFLLDYRPGQAPRLPTASLLDLTLEILPVPDIDNRVGAKDQPIDPPVAIPRLRARYLSASGFMAGGTVNGSTEVDGYRAPWLGFEAGYRFAAAAIQGEIRLFAISAKVTGPITEPGAKDEFDMRNRGGDLRLGLELAPLTIYGGMGAGHTESTLRVEADGARLEVDSSYRYWLAGVSAAAGPFLFTFEQNRTEDFLSHIILAASVQF